MICGKCFLKKINYRRPVIEELPVVCVDNVVHSEEDEQMLPYRLPQ